MSGHDAPAPDRGDEELIRNKRIFALRKTRKAEFTSYTKAGVAQLAEHQPSKLRVAGSIPVSRSIGKNLLINILTFLETCCFRLAGLFIFCPRSSVGGALPW